jgi:hypothetical protein
MTLVGDHSQVHRLTLVASHVDLVEKCVREGDILKGRSMRLPPLMRNLIIFQAAV